MVGGGVFKITELKLASNGQLTDTSNVFEWTAREYSAPRGPWKFGGEQRSVRTDYPGYDEPTEQILGPNFTPFTIKGIWDDRYMGAGNALTTYQTFEDMCWRGPMVRIEFDTISVIGLIKKWDFEYKRADYIGYEFEVSPHTRAKKPQIAKLNAGPPNPQPFNLAAYSSITNAQTMLYTVPMGWMVGEIWLDAYAILTELATLSVLIETVISGRLFYENQDAGTIDRIMHLFASMRLKARELITLFKSSKSSTVLILTQADKVLTYDAWQRGLCWLVRLIILQCLLAEENLSRSAVPRTSNLYRPAEGESLYAISQKFYGSPDYWRDIMEANGIETTVLLGVELLVIPPRTAA